MPRDIKTREELLSSLEGQTVQLPDLSQVFIDWPKASPEVSGRYIEQLTSIVNLRLDYLRHLGAVKPRYLNSLKAADFALFTALWWPNIPIDRACTLAFLVIWLFTWDDEIDEPSGFCSENLDLAERYRSQTQCFVRHTLGLEQNGSKSDSVDQRFHPIITSFDKIGSRLRNACALHLREALYREVVQFTRMSRKEQELRLDGRLATPAEYWQFRMGTSAVYIALAVAEFAIDSHLPDWIIRKPCMKALWDETNIIISITNDLYSLKKEVGKGCVDSAIPLISATGLTVQESISLLVDELQASRSRFNEAAAALSASVDEDAQLTEDVASFISVCQTNCTGNILWSLATPRYGLCDDNIRRENGFLVYKLERTS